MKKLLLMGAAALTAMSAMADKPLATPFEGGDDVTPKAYRFNEYDGEWRGFVCGESPQQWNLPNYYVENFITPGTVPFGDGLMVTAGPSYQYSTSDGMEALQNATQVVDFGGTLGKCLVINGKNSTLESKLADLGSNATGLKNYDQAAGASQLLLFVMTDPEVMKGQIEAGKHNFRIRITMNAYHGFDAATFANPMTANIYMNDDQGNVKGGDASYAATIKWDEFVYTYTEKTPDDPGDEPYEDEDGAYVWNPYRFMVYEFDATDVHIDEVHGVNPCRLKWGIHPSVFNQDAALIIRSIEYFVNDTDELLVDTKVKKTYEYFTYGEGAGVSDAVVAPGKEDGRIFNLQGIEVSNTNVPGIYIQNGKKFIVK